MYITISPTKEEESYGGAASNNQWEDCYRERGFVGSGSNTFTITVTVHPDTDEEGDPIETIEFCGMRPGSFSFDTETEFTVSNGVSTASATGKYIDAFEDQLKYLPRTKGWANGFFTSSTTLESVLGEDLYELSANNLVQANNEYIEELTVINGFARLPANTNLVSVSGNTLTYTTESWIIEARSDIANGQWSMSQDIYNDWEYYLIKIADHRKQFVTLAANTYVFSNTLMESTYGSYYY